MNVRIVQQRVEYQSRTLEVEVPDTLDLTDFGAVEEWLAVNDLELDLPVIDWDVTSATEEIASVEPGLPA